MIIIKGKAITKNNNKEAPLTTKEIKINGSLFNEKSENDEDVVEDDVKKLADVLIKICDGNYTRYNKF